MSAILVTKPEEIDFRSNTYFLAELHRSVTKKRLAANDIATN